MTLVRSSEDHGGGAVVAAAGADNNFQRNHSSSSHSSSSSGGGSAGEPWDQRDYAAIEVVKNDYNNNYDNSDNAEEDMRTTTTVYEPSDFTTTHEDFDDHDGEDLNDGELPSLSPKNGNPGGSSNNSVTSPRNNSNNNSSNNNNYATGLGRILGQAMPTTRPMQPPSQAGAMKSTSTLKKAAADNSNNKAQHRKFWAQLDEERQVQDNNGSNNNNNDNDEDGPHDEIAARREAQAIISSVRQQQQQQQQPGRRPQGVYDQDNGSGTGARGGGYMNDDNVDDGYQVLGGVESVSLSNASGQTPGETMTVDSSEEAAQAQSFCGQTLAAIGDMCGTSLALTSSQDNNNNKVDKTSQSRSAAEVRDDPPPSATAWESRHRASKQVERQEEHTAIEVEFVEPPQPVTSSNAIAAKKNAYLTAMAAKAKSEFDNKGNNNNNNKEQQQQQDDHASTSSTTSAVVIGPASNASMDIYGSFGAQEKRKFLKMINSGKSPSEASQRIVADRKVAAQKKQDVAEKKAARGGGGGGVHVPRLAFWRKNKKKNKNGKEHEEEAEGERGGDDDEEEDDDDELMSASLPPAQKSANGGGGSSYATSSEGSGNAEAADSRSTESPSPPPPPPPPDSTALPPRLSTTSPSSSVATSSYSSSKPTSILKKQLLTVDIPNPTSPKALSTPASPAASATASASRDNAKSPSSSVISAPPSDTAFYHPHRADNNKSYPYSTSSVPPGRVSGYLTTTPTSPSTRSAHSMPNISPGISAHYLSSPVTSGGGHSGYLSPVSTSHSVHSTPVSPSASALAMARGDNKRNNNNNRALSPLDRKNYVPPPPTPMHDDLPAAAIAAMRSLEATTATNTSPLELNVPKGSSANDFARISPLISRPDVDHDGSEDVDEDEYYGGQPAQQSRSQISEFAPSGINYYDAVRRDPHSDVDEELEAVIASVARGPNKNTKTSTIKKLKGPRLTSVSKPKGFAALKDGPKQQQQQQRSKSAPRAMRLAERVESVSPSPPPSPIPPLPHRLSQRDESPPRAQSEPGGGISPTRSRAATTNSAKTSIIQSAARSLTQAKLAAEASRRTGTGSATGSLLDTPSQDTDASSSNPIKWVEEEVIRRNASQRSGLSSSMSGDTGEMESQRRRAMAAATATPSQEVQSLPVVTPTVQAQDDKHMRPVTPPAISRTVERAASSSPNERAASIAFPVSGERSASASPPQSVKSEPVTSSPSRQAEKEYETHVDTKAMEIDMDTYLSSMDEIATHNGANFDSQSVYTSATGTSSYTQSSRKRRPGAAKERLAKTKGANQKTNGWHESIRAAATKTNRVWDPESGWTDYHDPDAIAPKSDEKIHINLERVRSKGSKDDTHLDAARRSIDETVSVPFPKEWETEREKMLGRTAPNVAVARVSEEEPRATRKIETQLIEPNATKKIVMKPLKKESPVVESTKPKIEDIMDTLPPIDLVDPPIPLDGPPRVAERTTPKRTGGASPHRARPSDVPSRPIGWLESMRAASAAIATDGRTWDPETGWVADGDEDDESIPDVVDFDTPPAVKEELIYEEDDVYSEPDIPPKATVVQPRDTSTESIPTGDKRTEKQELRRVLPIPSRDTDGKHTDGKLKQWVEKSEKTARDISATEDSDRAVASSSAVNEIYIQLGDNGSVREKSHQDVIAPPMVSDTVDFGAPPGLEFSAGDNEDEDARLLDNSGAFPSEDERPLSPPIRIKKEKIAAEDLRLFPPAESQEKRAGRRVAAVVAAAAKRDKLKQAREVKYSKEARAAQEHEERREAARLAEYARIEGRAATTMQRNVAPPQPLRPPPQPPQRLDDPSKRISTPPRSTIGQESGQHTPSSPPSPPLTRASGPITPSPQPLGRKPHKETNSLPLQAGKKQASLSASDSDEHVGKPMHPAEFKRKHSGPVDVDEVDDDWDSDEDQQHANNDWESRSNSPASSASKSKLTKRVPKLKASKRDTSPVRVRKEPAPAPAPAPARPSPELHDTNIPSRESSPTEEMLNSVPMVAPESPSVQERLRHWEAIVHEQPERREERTGAKVVTRNDKGEALKSSVEKTVVTERMISSRDLETEDRKVVTERSVSSANDENGDWESYVETTVVSERVVSTRDGNNVVERTMTTTQQIRGSPTSEMLNGKLLRKSRGDLFKVTKSEDEDSLFEFGDKKEANALVHSRLSPIRPVDDPDFDDEKTPSENLSVSDAYGPDPSDRRSFLQRLSECAAPVMAGRAGKTGDLPSAHLAFMSANQVQGSKAAAGRFVPPNLCGRPENIIEEAEDDESSVQSSPPKTQLARVVTPPPTQPQRPKSAPRTTMRGGDVRPTSSGSVVSDGFGAKTAYLEALAMKTAVSKPRKSRGRTGSSVVSGTSRASVTSRDSSQHSEKWKAFLDRKKKSSDPTPLKSRGSTTSELSTAAERYAAAKLEEMMAKMSEQSKASRAEDDEYEHEYGLSMEENARLMRKEKADLASYVRGRKLVEEARKTESVSAAHDLAAARVEAMMAALSSPQMEDEQAEI